MLLLTGGRLSFTTPRGTMFDVPVEQVTNIETPRMQLGAGFTCMIQGRKYTVNFVKVDMAAYNAAMQTARLAGGMLAAAGVGLGLVGAAKTLADFGNARETCDLWLTVLSSPYDSTSQSLFSDTPSSGGGAATPAAPPANDRTCPKCGTSFTRLSVQCPNCGAIST